MELGFRTFVRQIQVTDYGTCYTVLAHSLETRKCRPRPGKSQALDTFGMSASERAVLAKQAVKSIKISTYVAFGITGGIINGGLEAIFSYQDYKTGRITKGQHVNNVARETTSGAVSAVAVIAITTAVADADAPVLLTIGVGVATGIAIGTGISGLWKKVFN